MRKSKVYLIGAGPGDPDLITVRGLKILQQADVVIYDYLVGKKILECIKPCVELICADELTPSPLMGDGWGEGEKCSDGFTKRQDKINKIMIKRAKEGKKVVRLKNGDPLIFGRGNEELEALTENKIKFAVVPGVTAATAVGCFTGIPLTARGVSSSVVITTGHEASEKDDGFIDWKKISQIDTIVLYMAVENLGKITKILIEKGKEQNIPVAVISNATKINQRLVTGTLEDIEKRVHLEKISAPAVVIIGEVVKKEKRFNWFKKAKKVLFTGISPERFFEDGLIFHIPMIEIKPLDDYTALDNWIRKIFYKPSTANYQLIIDWIVFSSRFGVYYFFDRLFKLGYDTRILNGIRIAAIGSSTGNRLKEYGIIADLIPKNESSAGLLDEFKKILKLSMKVLLLRSDIADKGLSDGLRKLGADVFSCVAYRNVLPKDLPDMDFSLFDEIIFSSPSTVRNFIKRYGKPPEKIRIRTIGPVTKKEARKSRLL